MGQEELECSYVVGNTIALRLEGPYKQREVTARVTKVFEPFTLSCAMVVLLDSFIPGFTPALKRRMILKLFGRRFAAQFRHDYKVDPRTPNIERKYHDFILDGGGSEFITRLDFDSDMDEEEYAMWGARQNEAYAHYRMQALYETEVEVYNTMADVQGKIIPQLWACITMPSPSLTQEASIKKYIEIPMILLQYIDGFLLTDLRSNVPKDTWQSICDNAIQIIHRIGDRGILNKDIKRRSFIVREDPGNRFKMFMIYFALCDFRSEYGDEEEWREWKAM